MDVDVETHAHHHHTGHRWVDLSVAFSALFVSLVSVAIAIHHGHTMEKLVEANSWPSLQIIDSNADAQGGRDIRLSVANVGVGPARIGKFVVRYDGQPVHDAAELLRRCCGTDDLSPANKLDYSISQVLGRVLPARESIDFVHLRRNDASLAVWQRLDAARGKLSIDICYCSVFDECWIGHNDLSAPRRAASCELLHGVDYNDSAQPVASAETPATVPRS